MSRLTSAASIVDVLDHATSEIAIGSKLGIDATKKLPTRFQPFLGHRPQIISNRDAVVRHNRVAPQG